MHIKNSYIEINDNSDYPFKLLIMLTFPRAISKIVISET